LVAPPILPSFRGGCQTIFVSFLRGQGRIVVPLSRDRHLGPTAGAQADHRPPSIFHQRPRGRKHFLLGTAAHTVSNHVGLINVPRINPAKITGLGTRNYITGSVLCQGELWVNIPPISVVFIGKRALSRPDME